MSEATLPDDYDPEDGLGKDGLEQCPHCEKQLGGESGYHEEVFDSNGRRYEYFLNTDAGNGPFFCPDCWDELETNQRASDNQSLSDFA